MKPVYQSGRVGSVDSLNERGVRSLQRVKGKIETVGQTASGQWEAIANNYQHELLDDLPNKNEAEIARILANPLEQNFMYGFDNLARVLQTPMRLETRFQNDITADHIIALAEFLELKNYDNVEGINYFFRRKLSIDDLVCKINDQLFKGKGKMFHSPFVGETGIDTGKGICPLRAPSAIYQAVRSTSLGDKICEIGGGVGRTGYYSLLLGASEYSFVDLPIPNLVQSYYVGSGMKFINNLPDDTDKVVKYLLPSEFLAEKTRYDVVLNVDSLTEM